MYAEQKHPAPGLWPVGFPAYTDRPWPPDTGSMLQKRPERPLRRLDGCGRAGRGRLGRRGRARGEGTTDCGLSESPVKSGPYAWLLLRREIARLRLTKSPTISRSLRIHGTTKFDSPTTLAY